MKLAKTVLEVHSSVRPSTAATSRRRRESRRSLVAAPAVPPIPPRYGPIPTWGMASPPSSLTPNPTAPTQPASTRQRRHGSWSGFWLLLIPTLNFGVSVALGVYILMGAAASQCDAVQEGEQTGLLSRLNGRWHHLQAIAAFGNLTAAPDPAALSTAGDSGATGGAVQDNLSAAPLFDPEAAGQKQAIAGQATGIFKAPVLGYPITSEFGSRMHPIFQVVQPHEGLDVGTPVGTPIRVADGGQVSFAGTRGNYGKLLIIDHGNGYETRYAHLHEIYVKPNALVAQGDIIGLSGSTGVVTGPHLHFEVRLDGLAKDPLDYLK
ncbi:MAG: M23 family metallopeptidase [Synechococcales bacterium]|nr:M23 family metallopeptidase [Synechococcales bacterium]